jgi:hypothetical protein
MQGALISVAFQGKRKNGKIKSAGRFTTNAKGMFTAKGLLKGTHYDVRVEKSGYAPELVELNFEQKDTLVKVSLVKRLSVMMQRAVIHWGGNQTFYTQMNINCIDETEGPFSCKVGARSKKTQYKQNCSQEDDMGLKSNLTKNKLDNLSPQVYTIQNPQPQCKYELRVNFKKEAKPIDIIRSGATAIFFLNNNDRYYFNIRKNGYIYQSKRNDHRTYWRVFIFDAKDQTVKTWNRPVPNKQTTADRTTRRRRFMNLGHKASAVAEGHA